MKIPTLKKQLNKNFQELPTSYYHWDFEDIHEYLDVASHINPERITYASTGLKEQGYDEIERESFTGTKSLEQAVDLARYGWKQGLAVAKDIEKDFKISFDDLLPQQELVKNIIYREEGEIFHPDKFFSGDPEHMGKFVEDETSKVKLGNKFQRLVINGTIGFSVNIKTIFYTGVIYSRLINALELHGFNVELILRYSLLSNKSNLATVGDVTLKRFVEIIDEDKMIFYIANPSNLRRLFFSVCEHLPKQTQQLLGANYGYVTEYTTDLEQTYGEDGTIFLPSINNNLPKEQILKIVRDKVEEKFNPKERGFAI